MASVHTDTKLGDIEADRGGGYDDRFEGDAGKVHKEWEE